MSFGSLLTHPLAIVTPSVPDDTNVDERGHPIRGADTVVLVQGLVQPKGAREMTQADEAGAELSNHTIFLQPRNLTGAAYIRDEPDTGRRFDIVGVRSYEYGTAPHLEVDVKLVGSPEGPAVPGS